MAASISPECGVTTQAGSEEDEEEEESSYFDVMMIGKTGSGKSTVGNRLLDIDPETKVLMEAYRVGEDINNVIKRWDLDCDDKHYFAVGDGKESVTKKCKVLSNEKNKDRVLDTRGFADTENTRKYGVINGNLQSFRWILQAQKTHNLRFSRVLYFLPNRGPPERADGTLQEEISVMYSFFGQQIFDVMVVIVTNNKGDRYQQAGFSEENFAETSEVFRSAFRMAADTDLPKYPPVVYIAYGENPFKKILSADVISDAERLYFSPEYTTKTASGKFWQGADFETSVRMTLDMTRKEMKHVLSKFEGKCFKFEDRCARCAMKVIQQKLPSGTEVPVDVVDVSGSVMKHDDSRCHAFFIPKHSLFVRFVGGVAHLVTFGIGKMYERISKRKTWPWFTNSEEVCLVCKNPPGSSGCSPVNQCVEIRGESYMVAHSKELDTVQLLEEEIEDA